MFRLFFLKILFLYFISQNFLYSQIIDIIEVKGNKRFTPESIIIFSKLKVGKKLNENEINESLKELYDTGFFEDIEIYLDKNKILIDVKENPIIENLNITGIKKKNFLEFLYKSISLKQRSSFSKNSLEKDINLLYDILKTNGYYFSSIDTKFIENTDLNSISLEINVNLGKKAKIKNISFLGNKVFKDNKLLQIIASEENKFWKFISNKVYLNQNLINLDKNLLNNFYKNRGFYNVKILDNFIEANTENNTFNLIYNIDAGEKFYVNNFSLELPSDYSDADFDKIYNIFNKNKKQVYSQRIINQILEEIETIASSKLYDFIDVSVNENVVGKNDLNLNFVVSDSRKFYVEKINIFGNYNTIEEVVRNKLIVDEGDPLNNLLLNKSINQIKSLNIFKKVTQEIKNGSDDNYKVIDINVEEQPTGEISLAAGYGTTGFATGGSINENNFLGRGISLESFIELSSDSIKGEIIYSQPNFAYSDNTLLTSIKSIKNDFLSLYGYESKETSLSFGTRYEQFENVFFSPQIDLSFENLSTNANASNTFKKQEGNYTDLYFNYGLDYDARDSSFDPRNGYITNFRQELPLISDDNEISNNFIFTTYKELKEESEMVGRASFYLKTINTIDGSDVRISKRASVPYNRLRGFKKGKIGPIDKKDYIGGNYVSTLNLSTNLPAILPTIEILDFNYFIDIANVWGVDYNNSLDESKLRSSTGIGVNVVTPIGPLSFSFAQPILKSSSDQTETFRFNLGTTF